MDLQTGYEVMNSGLTLLHPISSFVQTLFHICSHVVNEVESGFKVVSFSLYEFYGYCQGRWSRRRVLTTRSFSLKLDSFNNGCIIHNLF